MDQNGLGQAVEPRQEQYSSQTSVSGASAGGEIKADHSDTQLTIIDGNTPVDDVLFASVFASMDLAVLKELKEAPPIAEAPYRDIDPSCLSDVSSSSSLSDDASDISEDIEVPHDVTALNDEGSDDGKCSRMGDVDDLDIFGDRLLTVKAHPPAAADKTFDIGSTCCCSNGQVVGMIIDTFGPTHSPFYVVRKKDDDSINIASGTELFIDKQRSTLALIDSSPSTDVGMEDDSVGDTSHHMTVLPQGQASHSTTGTGSPQGQASHSTTGSASFIISAAQQSNQNLSAGTDVGQQSLSIAPPPWSLPNQNHNQLPFFIPPPPPPPL